MQIILHTVHVQYWAPAGHSDAVTVGWCDAATVGWCDAGHLLDTVTLLLWVGVKLAGLSKYP